MIIQPKVRQFICLTAHPHGCAAQVQRQIDYVRSRPPVRGPKKVLVIGSSTGYGLASRIAAVFGCGADSIGVMFEKAAAGKRTATAGYYNNRAFEAAARRAGRFAETVNGDAFSDACKAETIERIQAGLGSVDLVVYSLAAPRRTGRDGTVWNSVIKPTGQTYVGKTLNLSDNTVGTAELAPAQPAEIEATIRVMGGEDWADWMRALRDAGCLAPGARTVAYSYIGPAVTNAIYRDGTIGLAKKDLYRTARELTETHRDIGLEARVSVNKAVVTQASAAIPSVSLYLSILYKQMKAAGTHEGCIEQMQRLFAEKLYGPEGIRTDADGLIRMDDLEMAPDLQARVEAVWQRISTETVASESDIEGYWTDFYNLFGFRVPGIDYAADVTDY